MLSGSLQSSGYVLMPSVMPSLQARVVLDSPKLPAKLPRSAYQLWMKQAGPDILSKLGGSFDNVGQRAKALSAEWKKVSEEEKARCAMCMSSLLCKSEPAHCRKLFHSAWHSTCSALSGGQILKTKRPGMHIVRHTISPLLRLQSCSIRCSDSQWPCHMQSSLAD